MSLLSEIFSDIFACQENCLTRQDPRVKLVTATAALLLVLFSSCPAFPFAVLVLCVTTTLMIGVPLRLIGLRLGASMGIAAILFVLQSTMVGSTPWWVVQPFGIVFKEEGVRTGLLLATRVLGAVSVLLLLSSVTPAHRIFCALRGMGVPQGWVEIALLIYRYLFVALDLAADLTAAQKTRLGYATPRRGLSSASTVAATLMIRSLDQAVKTHEAMRTRGCGTNIPVGALPKMRSLDWLVTAAAVSVLAGFFFLLEILCRP